MATKTRTELKAYFNTGDKPTEAQFADFINAVENLNDDGGNYKRYVALLSEANPDPPTATILENTIGAIVFSYSQLGDYVGTLLGAFPANKFYSPDHLKIFFSASLAVSQYWNITRIDDNSILVRVHDVASDTPNDGALLDTPFEIRVYN